ncbi:MAG: murein biosynthesis integral membrane protein MurJ, partial [SAR86 cluster bacterium]
SEYRSTKPLHDVQALINSVAGSLGGFLSLVTVFMMVAAPLIAVPIAYGFTDEPGKFALFVEMFRITFPYLLLISMTALSGAILNSYDRFMVPALTPALLNVSLISCALLLSPYLSTPELALAWGVLIAGIAQLLFQLPFLIKIKLLPVPKLGKTHEGVQRIKTLMVPALFGVSVSQINLLLDTVIASFLISGSVSWLYFSDRLVELPLGIYGIAIATVVLPSLSRKHINNSLDEFAKTLDWAFRLVCLIAIPATLALIIISKPLLITLFYNTNFTELDVVKAAGSLQAYALGLTAFMAVKIFAPGYFARQDTKTPVKIGIIAMCTNMLLNFILVFAFSLGHIGLALATSLAAFVNAGLLLRGLTKEGVFRFQPGWMLFSLRMVVANALLTVFLLYFAGDWQSWLAMAVMTKIIKLAALCLGGMALYSIALYGSGMRLKDLSH